MSDNLFAGVARIDVSTKEKKINDPLYAKTLVLQYNDKKYAFISIDYVSLGGGIGHLSEHFFSDVQKAVWESGINTFVCGVTHSHTSFPMVLPEEELRQKVLESVRIASSCLVPVTVGSGVGKNTDFAINRTLLLKDDTAWSIRQAHPCPPDDLVEDIDYMDESVEVLRFDKTDGTPLCVMFTFGCHPLLGFANNCPTSNYPGFAEKAVEDTVGCMAMMFQSCAGDVTEIDYKDYDKPKSCSAWGKLLGLSVLETLKDIKTCDAEIVSVRKEINLPRRKDIDEQIERVTKERDDLVSKLGGICLDFKTFLPLYMKYTLSPDYPLGFSFQYIKEEKEGKTQLLDQDKINRRNINAYLQNIHIMESIAKHSATLETLKWHKDYNASFGNKDVQTEVVCVRIGDTALVTAPFEPLSEIGRRIKAMSPCEKTFVIGYSNGYCHYGAPKEIYNNGGYETIECMLDSSWEDIYMSALTECFNKLR